MITLKEADDNHKAFWALNDKYPDYVRCVIYDHKSPPSHDLDLCKAHFTKKLKSASEAKIKEVNDMIEVAEENGQNISLLLTLRKKYRDYLSLDVSGYETLDQLLNAYPKDL